jgi:hypothetical protein
MLPRKGTSFIALRSFWDFSIRSSRHILRHHTPISLFLDGVCLRMDGQLAVKDQKLGRHHCPNTQIEKEIASLRAFPFSIVCGQ